MLPAESELVDIISVQLQSHVVKNIRKTNHVPSRAQKSRIARFMIAHHGKHGDKHLASKAVDQFAALFRGSRQATIMKPMRIWRARETFLNKSGDVSLRGSGSSFTCIRKNSGRKRVAWVDALHLELWAEFERLRRPRVKFNLKTLRVLATKVNKPVNVAVWPGSKWNCIYFHPHYLCFYNDWNNNNWECRLINVSSKLMPY